MIGGIPPEVDIKGKGMITAPLSGLAEPGGLGGLLFPDGLPLDYAVPITDLSSYGKAASARAWTPVFRHSTNLVSRVLISLTDLMYGAGIMYAYFNDIELNKGSLNLTELLQGI